MKLIIGILDDNESIIGIIKESVDSILKKHDYEPNIFSFTHYTDMSEMFLTSGFDLVFLDISMPDCDGVEYANSIRKKYPNTEIVFISSKEERVFDTFQANPLGFVRKSNFLNDINEVLGRYIAAHGKMVERGNEAVFVSKGSKVNVNLDNVMYIEGKGTKQLLNFSNGKEPIEISSTTMEKLENELVEYGFIRAHKGFLVNFRYIKSIGKGHDLTLKNGTVIQISRRKNTDVKEQFLKLCDKYNIISF